MTPEKYLSQTPPQVIAIRDEEEDVHDEHVGNALSDAPEDLDYDDGSDGDN